MNCMFVSFSFLIVMLGDVTAEKVMYRNYLLLLHAVKAGVQFLLVDLFECGKNYAVKPHMGL